MYRASCIVSIFLCLTAPLAIQSAGSTANYQYRQAWRRTPPPATPYVEHEILCANTSQAKGRVERAHHTLQDRLVKELRLAGISTIEAANAFLPAFVQTYNARFAKPPASERDLHRPIAGTNDLDDILCWREQRSVSRQLVINYNRMKFMLRPNKTSAALAGKVVDIYDFPDGRLEIRWKGLPLSYSVFDHLQRVSHAAIIENKRLGEVLAWISSSRTSNPIIAAT
jgi:hypothetical protein